MEPYTLGRDYLKKDIIDGFNSIIWTERYYGDSEVELVVPKTPDMIRKLPTGIFLGLEESDDLMILETVDIDDEAKTMKYKGISVLPWLNNRFIRASAAHKDRYWYLDGNSAGWVLWAMVYYMCVGGEYLDGTTPIGIANPAHLILPGLGLNDYDTSGDPLNVGIPYGPLYDAMKNLASTYEIGMQIIFDPTNTTTPLQFRSYKGVDRTSQQSNYSIVRFTPTMDSLANIKEIISIAQHKTEVYAFAPGLEPEDGQPDLRTVPGVSALPGTQNTGFDLRAKMIFADDITTDQVGGDPAVLVDILNNRANDELTNDPIIRTVDGEIVPNNPFQYGIHYNLGDIIEVEGTTGTIQEARITEFIRAQDSSGEKAYPTVSAIG